MKCLLTLKATTNSCDASGSGDPTQYLVCAAARCDAAVSRLLNHVWQIIEKTIWMASDADREEAVQKAWIQVWARLVKEPDGPGGYSGEGELEFDNWVKKIAKNMAGGEIRHQGRKSAPELGLGEASGPKPEPEQSFTSAFVTKQDLAMALSRLPPHLHEAYVLREMVGGYTYKSLGQALGGVSAATAWARVDKARILVNQWTRSTVGK